MYNTHDVRYTYTLRNVINHVMCNENLYMTWFVLYVT